MGPRIPALLSGLLLAANADTVSRHQTGLSGAPDPPLVFAPNVGQTNNSVRFVARAGQQAFYFMPGKAVLDMHRGKRAVALELRFRGSDPNAEVIPERRHRDESTTSPRQLGGPTSTPTGSCVTATSGRASTWSSAGRDPHSSTSSWYTRARDPADIRLAYAGANRVTLANGGLNVATPLGKLRDARRARRPAAKSPPAMHSPATRMASTWALMTSRALS